ncbi:MAG TPA: hypothetical protein PLL09_04600 [Flavobacterium sp.]|uniref:hypothetical protein n=1 Tax=unclassified Flavobacterium TaxID=196869 RepID=UPI0025BC45DB|nr:MULTISPECIES: hypothetical protein [unclassified Flavobacterium]HRE77088.1 hypothetical protein [Flavobacterium sp.]
METNQEENKKDLIESKPINEPAGDSNTTTENKFCYNTLKKYASSIMEVEI